MRVAAAGLAAIIASLILSHDPSARADESNPFPSPSPTASPVPGLGGYAVAGMSGLSASGGLGANASTTGYSLELLGRLSPSYSAMVRFEDANIHGTSPSVISRFDLTALYGSPRTPLAGGIGFTSLQRSVLQSSANGIGAGLALLPDFSRRSSPYASLFFYPSLGGPNGARGGLSVLRAGVTFTPHASSGLFARAGFTEQHYGASTFSPTSLSGVEVGAGATF